MSAMAQQGRKSRRHRPFFVLIQQAAVAAIPDNTALTALVRGFQIQCIHRVCSSLQIAQILCFPTLLNQETAGKTGFLMGRKIIDAYLQEKM